jgi:hypothetical protein
MEPLRKIPLEMLLNILQDLYDGGADYVDISGDNNIDGELKDTIKFTVKPEYLSEFDDDDDVLSLEQELKMDYSGDEDVTSTRLSDEDINDLI